MQEKLTRNDKGFQPLSLNACVFKKNLQASTHNFLYDILDNFECDRSWILSIERETNPQFKAYSLAASSCKNITEYSIEIEDISILDEFENILSELDPQFNIVPKKLSEIIPVAIRDMFLATRHFSVIYPVSNTPILIGICDDAPCNNKLESNANIYDCLVHSYQRNISDQLHLINISSVVDDLDAPILHYDLSLLNSYFNKLDTFDASTINQIVERNFREIASILNKTPILYMNKACSRLFEVTNTSQLLDIFKSNFKHSIIKFVKKFFLSILAQDEYFHCEVVIKNVQNQDIHIVFKLKLPKNKIGFSQVVICLTDISEQKQAEKKMKETLLRYELVVKGSLGSIWDWDIPSETVHYSPQWAAMRGYDISELDNLQDQWVSTIHPDDKARVLDALNDHFLGKTEIFEQKYRIICKDESIRWVVDRGVAKRNKNGDVIRMAGSEFDITEKRMFDERLRLGASVFENTAEGIMILNTQRVIIDINKALSKLSGFTKQYIIGKRPEDFLLSKESFSNYWKIWELLKTDHTWQGEIWNKNNQGKRVPFWLTISCVYDTDNELTHYVGLMTDISHVKKSEKKLYRLAHHDDLTGLPNRLLLIQRLDQAIKYAKRQDQKISVVFMDLDNFKLVNDSLGHTAGDNLLIEVAKKLTDSVREQDTVSRIGGDEFVIILIGIDNPDETAKIVSELLKILNDFIELANQTIRVTASMGISVYPHDGIDSNTLISNADAAMYRAKSMGKHNFQFYTQDLTRHAIERMSLESNLQDAMNAKQFILYYQPQYNLSTRKLSGFEALIRWHHPQQGLLGPVKFIPLAEETGFIEDIGTWVIEQACFQASLWLEKEFNFGSIAVNVSSKQLFQGNLVSIISEVLNKFNLPAKYLEVEITESMIMMEPEKAIDQLHQLRELGINIAIDDFGTGYSSLSQLNQLPIQHLKIDKSFITDIAQNNNDTVITETIIAMAERLNLKVIAEGVETIDQEDFLLEKQCNEVQGYLYSKPKPAEDISDLDLIMAKRQ